MYSRGRVGVRENAAGLSEFRGGSGADPTPRSRASRRREAGRRCLRWREFDEFDGLARDLRGALLLQNWRFALDGGVSAQFFVPARSLAVEDYFSCLHSMITAYRAKIAESFTRTACARTSIRRVPTRKNSQFDANSNSVEH